MTVPWWGKEASPLVSTRAVPAGGAPDIWPSLVDATREVVFQELCARIKSYTPDWTNQRASDAGIAVAHLFSEEMEPVLQRLNELPENCFIQFLGAGGVTPFPPTAAEALVQFTVSTGATQSLYLPQGFQMGAPPAGGGTMVIFETNDDLYAAPGQIQEMYAFENGLYRAIDPTSTTVPFQPFGANPRPGVAFFIGLSAAPSVLVGPQISLGIQVQGPAGQPPPVSTGGSAPLPTPLAPLLQWEILDGGSYQPAEVASDGTDGLTQSGVVTLRLPAEWNPAIPAGAPDSTPLLWLRLQILYGAYPQTPTLLCVLLNTVLAIAVQTYSDEALTPVPNTNGAVMTLSQSPVLPGSLVLQVDDTTDISYSSPSQTSAANSSSPGGIPTAAIWTEVDDLSEFGPTAQVYELDPATGQVTFGDGTNGMAVPPGFRNVVALTYQVGGGSGGAVGAGQITNLVNSVPFLSGVTNPFAATGGTDAETTAQVLARGPQEIRARGRSVAPADYEVLALHATGALVARAHAVPGFHPSFPGTLIPGVVCVFVIPPERGSTPPIPDDGSLLAVSSYLSGQLAPAGVEVVAAAPVYHSVRVEVSVVIETFVSRGDTVNSIIAQINSYLDPITGGDDGTGWPFGGTLSYVSLVRQLLSLVNGVTAVSTLVYVVDGVRGANCTDFPISANSLVWPAIHEVIVTAGASS
jgi:predicted phage baseplate assembly protein